MYQLAHGRVRLTYLSRCTKYTCFCFLVGRFELAHVQITSAQRAASPLAATRTHGRGTSRSANESTKDTRQKEKETRAHTRAHT